LRDRELLEQIPEKKGAIFCMAQKSRVANNQIQKTGAWGFSNAEIAARF
jgi:hypothetical protein